MELSGEFDAFLCVIILTQTLRVCHCMISTKLSQYPCEHQPAYQRPNDPLDNPTGGDSDSIQVLHREWKMMKNFPTDWPYL